MIRMKQEEETALTNACTFHPNVSTTAKSRYMESANELGSLMSFNKTYRESADESESEYTFKPAINSYRKALKHTCEYLNTDPYIRLTQHGGKDKANSAVYYTHEEAKPQKQPNLKGKLKEFFDRQYSFVEKKKENKLRMLKNMEVNSNPKIDKRSQVIAKNRTRSPSSREIIKIVEDDKDCTFQPKILPMSTQRKQKTYDEMSYEPVAMKEAKVELIKKSITKQQEKVFTFHPKLNKDKKAKSKLLLGENVNAYAKKIKLNKSKQQSNIRMSNRINHLKEMEQYTYKPIINQHNQIKPNASSKQIMWKKAEIGSYSKIHKQTKKKC
eukprot:TRINITY_DN1138_c0_g1_i2.p1 TRINITY_DN1138_c0_g1~~TRINITY_DN1138_c0_g1_i2.p1  ORF type:complete len:327 (-),score=76.42 TRINITY_DN1138_c0_g1_i2:151-1131(-)